LGTKKIRLRERNLGLRLRLSINGCFYHRRLFHSYQDKFLGFQFLKMERYQVIPRTLIFIFHDEKILLLKGAPDKKNFPHLYNGLGGHVERGETILECARRELKEECGLTLLNLTLCGILTDITGEQVGIQIHLFKGSVDQLADHLHSSSEGTIGWFRKDEVAHLELVPDVPFYLETVWNWKPGDPLIFGIIDRRNTSDNLIRFTVA